MKANVVGIKNIVEAATEM